MSTPRISVVVPVYNAASLLPRCIEALLDQSLPNCEYEIIIVDNASTDSTKHVVKRYPVHYVAEFDVQSSYAARNAGINSSTGQIIAFTDADCVPRIDWLENALRYFEDDNVGGVAGQIVGAAPQNWLEEELVRRNWLSERVTLSHSFLPFVQTANAFYRRDVFKRVGLFEETWPSGGDADLSWRMQLETHYGIVHAPDVVIEHRHRSTVKSLMRQCVKWGYGNAILAQKYGSDTVNKGLRSSRQTGVFLMRSLGGYLKKTLRARMRGKNFVQAPKYIVDIVSRGGMQMGFIYGRVHAALSILHNTNHPVFSSD